MIPHALQFILTLSTFVYSVGAACPEHCDRCDVNDSSSCTSCRIGHWGLKSIRCNLKCNENCLNKDCDDETGNCISCKLGLYGLQCQHNCSLCKGGLCDLEFCTNGCKAGFHVYNTGTEILCSPCPSDCSICVNSSMCNVCNDGYQLYKPNVNDNIVVHCRLCTQTDVCSNACEIQNCKSCIVVGNVLSCTECNNGYTLTGGTCLVNEGMCSEGCSTECDKNGICTGNCSAGWTGDKCSNTCAEKCFSCDKSSGNICKECKGDYYTATCDLPCKQSCIKMTGKVTCRLNDGYCKNGCENKTWGPFCNKSCSVGCADNGNLQVCNRTNGYCLHGCIGGFTGENCDVMLSVISTTQSEAKSSLKTKTETSTTRELTTKETNVMIIGGGVGGGVFLLLLIVVLNLCFVKRRYNRDDPGGINEEIPKFDSRTATAENRPNEKEYLYAQPMKPKTKKEQNQEEKQDYVYAQPSKPKKDKKPSRTGISEPQKLYDNIAIDLEEEQETAEETSLDRLELETLDEGIVSFIETEIEIPTSDTYYNTTGFNRSRIQVSNLFQYISKKTDYEKEFEKLPKGLTRTCNEALKPKNIAKNRFNGIYAYDATRVVIGSKNYVNANYIDGHTKSPEYIASLGKYNIIFIL